MIPYQLFISHCRPDAFITGPNDINPMMVKRINPIKCTDIAKPFHLPPDPAIKKRIQQFQEFAKVSQDSLEPSTYFALGIPKKYATYPSFQEPCNLDEAVEDMEKLREWLSLNGYRLPKIYIYIGSTTFYNGVCNDMVRKSNGSLRTLRDDDNYVVIVKRVPFKTKMESERLELITLVCTFVVMLCVVTRD